MRNLIKVSLMLGIMTLSTMGSAVAANDEQTGTITVAGELSPKVVDVLIALRDCGADTDLATCTGTLNSVSFSGHSATASLTGLGNIENDDAVRYVQFEVKSRLRIHKDDYLKIQNQITASTNSMTINLEKLRWVSGGNSSKGQTTLGVPTTNELAANAEMIDDQVVLSTSVQDVYDQLADNPGVVNSLILDSIAATRPVVLRGILGIEVKENSTSSAYSVTIQFKMVGVDNT